MSENFKIVEIKNDKKRFIQLLLIGDESEAMIDRYLQKGNLYVGISNDISIAVCVTLTQRLRLKILQFAPISIVAVLAD